MRRTLFWILALAVVFFAGRAGADENTKPSVDDYATKYAADGYHLAWSDEFEIDGPPSAKNWNYERGFVRNHEAQWYQPANARCEGGMLIIEAKREQLKNPNYSSDGRRWPQQREFAEYTSASMTTRGLHEWTYGRFEMRGRIDTRPGIWPAWWMLGRGRWPAAGEIDIMEYYRGMLKANIAWAGKERTGGAASTSAITPVWNSAVTPIEKLPVDWSKQFHTWRMDWDDKHIKLFVDDVQLNDQDLSQTIDDDAARTNPFIGAPQYMILNVAIGGDQGGDPSKTEFPAKLEVDWVRVYQR